MDILPPIFIVCTRSPSGAIGKKGGLPWKRPSKENLTWFRCLTDSSAVVMGASTWKSLPKKPLYGRINVVISSVPIEGADYVFPDLMKALLSLQTKAIYIIGGQALFEEAYRLGMVDGVYEIILKSEYEGCDRFMPPLPDDFDVHTKLWESESDERWFYSYTFKI